MKKFRYSIRMLVLLLFTGSYLLSAAQSNLYLRLNSQTTQSILISSVKKIVFENDNMIFNFQNSSTSSFPISSVSRITFNPSTDTKTISSEEGKLTIYPNPVVNQIFIKNLSENVISVTIYQLNGSAVYRAENPDITNGIDVSNLHSGLYLVKINGQTFKISKQ